MCVRISETSSPFSLQGKLLTGFHSSLKSSELLEACGSLPCVNTTNSSPSFSPLPQVATFANLFRCQHVQYAIFCPECITRWILLFASGWYCSSCSHLFLQTWYPCSRESYILRVFLSFSFLWSELNRGSNSDGIPPVIKLSCFLCMQMSWVNTGATHSNTA